MCSTHNNVINIALGAIQGEYFADNPTVLV